MKNIIACGNFQKEIELATDGKYKYFYHNPLCLDNKYRNRDLIQEIIDENKLDDYSVVCCGICKNTHKGNKSQVSSKDLCFYQILNKQTVDYYMKKGYYLVTPGWLSNWSYYLKDDWKFTKEIAELFFKNSFDKILLLDTETDSNSIKNLISFSNFINKEYEVIPVGMDYYNNYIHKCLNTDVKPIIEESKNIKNQLVNFTMSLDLIKNMSTFTNENQLVDRIFDILRMMFMPKEICYLPFKDDKLKKGKCTEEFHEIMLEFVNDNSTKVYWLENDKGFASKIFFGDELIGILLINEIFLPEYKETYYNTFQSISNVISLALYNSRLYEQVLSVSKDYQQQKSYFEQLFKNSPEMIIITNNNLNIQNTNFSFNSYFDLKNKIHNMPLSELFNSYSSNYNFDEFYESMHKKQITQFTMSNGIRHIEISRYPIQVFDQTAGYYVVLNDVTGRVTTQEKLKFLAFNDSLTGLYNRAFCDEEMARLAKNRQLPLGIIIGDVNGLKVTNDAFGHIAGDKILKQIAEIIKSSCRSGEIVSRWGGDEYVIILPNTSLEIIKNVVHRIDKKCSEFKGFDYVLPSISLGYSVLDTEKRTISEVFIEAEKMMYENKLLQKTSIRNRIVASLESSLYEKSFETEEHAIRVSKMCVEISKHLGFNKQQINEMELFARLHDIGKLLIDNQLLEKKEPLTDNERRMIQEHSESGYRIANSIAELSHISNYILHHHERWDGSGYPNRIKGYQIPIQSRILAIADAIDAMRSERPYKLPFPDSKVLKELKANRERQFDPTLVDIFIELYFSD